MSKGKNKIIKFSTKVDNVQRNKKYSSQINLKALFKCEVTARSSRRTKQRGITLCPHPRENALEVALIIQRRYKRLAGSKPAPNIYFSNILRKRRNTQEYVLLETGDLFLVKCNSV